MQTKLDLFTMPPASGSVGANSQKRKTGAGDDAGGFATVLDGLAATPKSAKPGRKDDPSSDLAAAGLIAPEPGKAEEPKAEPALGKDPATENDVVSADEAAADEQSSSQDKEPKSLAATRESAATVGAETALTAAASAAAATATAATSAAATTLAATTDSTTNASQVIDPQPPGSDAKPLTAAAPAPEVLNSSSEIAKTSPDQSSIAQATVPEPAPAQVMTGQIAEIAIATVPEAAAPVAQSGFVATEPPMTQAATAAQTGKTRKLGRASPLDGAALKARSGPGSTDSSSTLIQPGAGQGAPSTAGDGQAHDGEQSDPKVAVPTPTLTMAEPKAMNLAGAAPLAADASPTGPMFLDPSARSYEPSPVINATAPLAQTVNTPTHTDLVSPATVQAQLDGLAVTLSPATETSSTSAAAAPPTQATTAAAPQLESIVEQLRMHATPGVSRISFIVDPPELGRLTIRLAMRRGRLVGEISAEDRDVAKTLESGLAALKNSLRESGLNVETLRINQDNAHQPEAGLDFADRRASSEQGERDRSDRRADRDPEREESARSKRTPDGVVDSGRVNLMA